MANLESLLNSHGFQISNAVESLDQHEVEHRTP